MYDAERTAKMAPILDRIPDAWGKYLPDAGWDDMLLKLDAELTAIDPTYVIYQAKEKFGTLRFYIEWSEELSEDARAATSTLIQKYEAISEKTCELCGSGNAKLRVSGWYKTFCDTCAAKEGK